MTAAFEMAQAVHGRPDLGGPDLSISLHLLDVCSIALVYGADEDQAVSALLHTTIKHGGGMAKANEIGEVFGERVKMLVLDCSDCVVDTQPTLNGWWQHKVNYLNHLRDVPPEAALVMAAEKLSGARSIITGLLDGGDKELSHLGAGRVGVLWFYRSIAETLPHRLHQHAGGVGIAKAFASAVGEMVHLVGEEQATLDWDVAVELAAAFESA